MKKKAFHSEYPCHCGPVEVIKNLFCGSEDESPDMAAAPIWVDTLIPLNSLGAEVWNLGFRGEILYCPIQDYGVLPNDVLEDLVLKILDRLSSGKKVGLFCLGGHGRTGYIASVVLGKLGYKDPIGFLRSNYCRQAVESNAQIQHIAEVLKKPELAKKYKVERAFKDISGFWDDYNLRSLLNGFGGGFFPKRSGQQYCGNCSGFANGICRKYNTFMDEFDFACDHFTK